MMFLFIGLLHLFIVFIDITHSVALPLSSKVETHQFRWATGNDLNGSRCAFPSTPWRFPNDTLHPDPEWSKLHGCTILLGAASIPEDDRLICQGKNSLFALIGNPGVIWHPLTKQCVHVIEIGSNMGDTDPDHPFVHVMHKTLITSCECDLDSPTLARFTYDKNKPQRLSYLKEDIKTGEKEEWCIRNWYASSIQVVPKCDFDPRLEYQQPEAIFHEVF